MQTNGKADINEIAFFDFDGTITTKDTLAEILKFIKGRFNYYLGILILSPVLILFKLKLITNHRAKEILLTYFLKGMNTKEFDASCKEFSETKLPQMFKRNALREIRKYLQNNTPVVIISASAENWILPWCAKYNIECIATKLQVKNGKLTGKIEGRNCSGEEKARHIRDKYQLSSYAKIYAYGDSKSDLPMLSLATEKYYNSFKEFTY
jgi:HAD superfamily hydrolase (TIGR01490 family)